tara:strand:- start:144 stop:347 length:204 start_codon:yes stop_codon:yes gene_type:complete
MNLSDRFNSNNGTYGMWASVVCKDGTVFEGVIQDERSYGIYILIGGDPDRLSMFTWTNVDRVIYREV